MDKNARLIGRFRNFINSIAKDDVVAVMHHTDPDGVCSGVIIAKLIEKIRGKKIDLHINQAASEISVLDRTVKQLKEAKVNKLVMTDLSTDQAPANIGEIEKFAEILIIDHHKLYKDLNSEKTVFIKPQLVSGKKPGSYPAAKFCFDLASEIAEINELDWIAAIGLIGDCAFNAWKEFLGEVFAKYGIEKNPDIFQTGLGRCASLISDAESFDASNSYESFEVVYSSQSPKDVLNSSLQKYMEPVESEISYWKGHIREFAEFIDDLELILYMIKPKYRIKAPLSTHLSLEYPNKTILIMQDSGDGKIRISARRRDEKVAVNDLLENAVKGLEEARGGGHIPAAGATIRKEDFQEFKQKIIGFLKNG
jgi:single-stranded DNA-specific DHH superfamily exonuclease